MSNLIKLAVSRSQSDEEEEESGEPPARKTAATFDPNNADDVLFLHSDGDLDDQEEKLCISAKKSNDPPPKCRNLVQDHERECREEEPVGPNAEAAGLADLMNGRFKTAMNPDSLKKKFES